MTWTETLTLLLGSDILAGAIVLLTMRSTIAKARAEADRAKAEAESLRIANTDKATRILMENIVKPLKDELHATREDLAETKREMARNRREMARLRKAIDGANVCDHRDGCPVLDRLRDIKTDRDEPSDDEPDGSRNGRKDGEGQDGRDGAEGGGKAGGVGGQPP